MNSWHSKVFLGIPFLPAPSKGLCLNPKGLPHGTPYHPLGTPWRVQESLLGPSLLCWQKKCRSCQVAGYAKELQALFEIFAAAADMRMLEQAPIFSFQLELANVAGYLPASSKIEFSQTKGQESPHSPPKLQNLNADAKGSRT